MKGNNRLRRIRPCLGTCKNVSGEFCSSKTTIREKIIWTTAKNGVVPDTTIQISKVFQMLKAVNERVLRK